MTATLVNKKETSAYIVAVIKANTNCVDGMMGSSMDANLLNSCQPMLKNKLDLLENNGVVTLDLDLATNNLQCVTEKLKVFFSNKAN